MKVSLLTGSALLLLMVVQTGGVAADNDKDRLQGTWVVVSSHLNEREVKGEKGVKMVIANGKLTVSAADGNKQHEAAYELAGLDPAKEPKEITLKSVDEKGVLIEGIYEIRGDELKLCLAHNVKRPTKFSAPRGPGTIRLYVLKREKQN